MSNYGDSSKSVNNNYQYNDCPLDKIRFFNSADLSECTEETLDDIELIFLFPSPSPSPTPSPTPYPSETPTPTVLVLDYP